MGPLEGVRYARAIARGVRRGHVFPREGRLPPRPAPGGTRRGTRPWNALNELDRVEVTEHVVPVPGLAREVRVLHLTDVHVRGVEPRLERLAAFLRGLRPDLLVLTGDVVTRGWTEEAASLFLSALPEAPLGRWGVIGNWEYWGGAPPERWAPILEGHDVGFLRDVSVDLGALQIVGTDDVLAGSPDVEAAFRGTDASRPILALTHSPAIFPALARPGVRVVLAGHTHAGQVRLPFVGPFFLPRGTGGYACGWYERDGTWLFVNRGVGWSMAPLRLGAPPEIAWVRLVPG